MISRRCKTAASLLTMVVLMVAPTLCLGQSSLGTISGTVTDSNGAAVSGARVEATNKGTGEKRNATSADNGTYSIPNLAVGTYSVTATATGFAVGTVQEVKVSVAFSSTVNLTLNPTGATESVTVTSGDVQTQVNQSDQQLSTLISNQKIIDLPLLSRDPNALILLAPGTTQTNSALGGFSVNGSRERNNNFMVDGVDNNDTEVPGIAGGLATPNIDATQEFRVITSNPNAEYGRNTGATISVVTKGGSNDLHGNAYLYYRSNAFSARDFFDISGESDPLQRKQFGGSIGGPIKKDKAFFFFNYEGDRFVQGFQSLTTVPSASARIGILPNTPFGTLDIRQNGANNVTGSNVFGDPNANVGFDPVILQLLSVYPLGNDPKASPLPGVFDAFRFGNRNVTNVDSTAARVDYRFNDKYTVWGSHNFSDGTFNTDTATFPGFDDGLEEPFRSQVISLNFIANIRPTLTNEARFGYNRVKVLFNGPGDGTVSYNLQDTINNAFSSHGLPLAAPFGGKNGSMINLSTGALTDLAGFDSQFRYTGTTTVGDSLTYVRGSHTMKGGVELRAVYANSATDFFRSETLTYDVPTTFGVPFVADNSGADINPFSGVGGLINNYASFLYGFVSNQFQSQFFNKDKARTDADYRGFRVREFDAFFQDNWKVRSNLTLNYGIRWEYKGVPYEVNGLLSTLVDQDPSGVEPAGGFVFQLVGKNSGGSSNLYKDDHNNFGPRFGLAWSPDADKGFISKLTGGPGKTSIRGGYGIFYDRIFGNLFSNARGNPPFQQDFNNFAGDLQGNIGRPPTLPTSFTVASNAEFFPILFPLPGNNPFQGKLATPYEQKWNFGLQREIGHQFLVEADYVGAKGTNEIRVIDGQLTSVPRVNALTGSNTKISTSAFTNLLNGRLNDAFFQTALTLTTGISSYNALQLRATKQLTNSRFGTGQFQAAYTWSHSIDDSTDPLVAQSGERSFPRDSSGFAGGLRAERGNSGFDTRHRFVANFTYELPIKFSNAILDRSLGHFELSGIVTVQSGRPYSVFGGTDSAGTGLSQRADFGNGTNNLVDPNPPLDPRTQTGPRRSLFANPCPADSTNSVTCAGTNLVGRQGTVGRSAFVGPAFRQFDFSVIKRIPITEKLKLRIQADFFNLFNQVNFAQPVNTINSLNFGQSTFTQGLPRIMQFAARVDF